MHKIKKMGTWYHISSFEIRGLTPCSHPMKKLHFDELSTGFLTRSELCIDFILKKV